MRSVLCYVPGMSTTAEAPRRGFVTIAVSTSIMTRLNTLGARLQFRALESRGVRVSRTAVIEELLDCWDSSHPDESSQPKSETEVATKKGRK